MLSLAEIKLKPFSMKLWAVSDEFLLPLFLPSKASGINQYVPNFNPPTLTQSPSSDCVSLMRKIWHVTCKKSDRHHHLSYHLPHRRWIDLLFRPPFIFITIVAQIDAVELKWTHEKKARASVIYEQFSRHLQQSISLCKMQLEIRREAKTKNAFTKCRRKPKTLDWSLCKNFWALNASHLPQFSSIKLKNYYCHCYCCVLSFNSFYCSFSFFFFLFCSK